IMISPYNAAVRPYTTAPCSCVSTVSGFTRIPQSAAHTTRCTRTAPSDATETSATWHRNVSPNCHSAMPRDRPAGGADPHAACCAARSSTPTSRGRPATSSRRYAYGSFPAARVEPGAQHVVRRGPVHRVLDVVLARPHHLDGHVDLLRQLHRLGRIVRRPAAPPEAAAEIGDVHGDRLDRKARHLRPHSLHALRVLRGRPDLAP